MSQLILTGQRLQLHYLDHDDAGKLRDYLIRNRLHLAPWEPARDPAYFQLEQISERIKSNHKLIEAGLACFFTIIYQQQIIGVCNYSNLVRGAFQACHLGYAIDYQFEGKGLMHEALQLSLPYMFEQQGLHRIMANYLPENQRSGKLLQRLGFEREGYARRYLHINGEWRDHILTALVAKE